MQTPASRRIIRDELYQVVGVEYIDSFITWLSSDKFESYVDGINFLDRITAALESQGRGLSIKKWRAQSTAEHDIYDDDFTENVNFGVTRDRFYIVVDLLYDDTYSPF